MNSTEGLKGFITFSMMALVVSAMVFSFNYFRNQTSSNLKSGASNIQITPITLEAKNITYDNAEIIWLTESSVSGTLIYSKEPNCKNNCTKIKESQNNTNHKIILTDLEPNTTYYYQVKIDKSTFPEESLTFTTKNVEIIAEAEIEEITTSNEANNETPLTVNTGNTPESSIVSPDGYYNSQPFSEGPFNTTQPKKVEKVLGAYSDVVNKELFEEFKEALIYQDKNYDFNKDDKVTNQDYPLFMYFIVNQ